MKIKTTWEGNTDGSVRLMSTKRGRVKLWVLVQDQDDKTYSGECLLRACARDTQFMGWLKRVAPRMSARSHSRADRRSQARFKVSRLTLERTEYVVSGCPRRFFPYWLLLRAVRTKDEQERVRVYIVPRLNRALSLLFVASFALLLTYCSWLWLRLTSDSLPKGIATFAGTGSAVLGPLAALVAPVFSLTARRFVMDSLVSGAASVAALVGALALHHYQDPVYIENETPAAIHVSSGSQVSLEAGAAAVLPREELDRELRDYLACEWESFHQGPCALPQEHWFNVGQYCLRDKSTDAQHCLELRPANLITQLQRWLAFGDIIRIGCKSVEGLDPDAIATWRMSGSCKHDPELKVVRSLHEHLVRTMERKPESPPPCTEPSGEVTLHPFRLSSGPGDAFLPAKPVVLELISPSAGGDDSVPSWHFTSQGALAELRTSASRDEHGRPCREPYLADCRTQRDGTCPGLFAPRGEVAATLEQGDQRLGSLWCSERAGRIFATRVMSRLLGLTIFTKARRALSHYDSLSTGPGGWIAWCEPDGEKASASESPPLTLDAEALLPEDWQPVRSWTWDVPRSSQIDTIEIVVSGHGRWGNLTCDATGAPRLLSLVEIEGGKGRPVSVASAGKSRWTRYGTTSPFPEWAWRCRTSAETGLQSLDIRLEGGTRGVASEAGTFSASTGEPCVIDPMTLTRVPGRVPAGKGGTARDALLRFPVANCDPARSTLLVAGDSTHTP